MSDLHALANWLQPLIGALQPGERRSLARHIARELRSYTQASMRAQRAPDGTPWQARRARIISQHGVRAEAERARQRKGPMMVKLRQARYLHTSASEDEAALEFAGRVARIARVHHMGLPDRVARGGPEHVYAERPLIGISPEIVAAVKTIVLDHLSAAAKKT